MFPRIGLEVWKRQTLLTVLIIELQCLGLPGFTVVNVPPELPRLYVTVNGADNLWSFHYAVTFNLPFLEITLKIWSKKLIKTLISDSVKKGCTYIKQEIA